MSALNDLISQIEDKTLRDRIAAEVDRMTKQKKFGLVFEEHLPECTPLYEVPVRKGGTVARKDGRMNDVLRVVELNDGVATCVHKTGGEPVRVSADELVSVAEFGDPIYPQLIPIDAVENAPDSDLWHTLIEADNYHALQLLEYLYAGQVDCIYIDPPYNTGAKDWKYNNDYVDRADAYHHSKWLSMMEKRLRLAKRLLNPKDSVLIVTIDEKEYLHLGCLLEEMFPEARIQMVSSVINSAGVSRGDEFSHSNEFIFFVKLGVASPASLPLPDEWRGNMKSTKKNKLVWNQLMRAGTNARRVDRPNLFYPLFVSLDGKRIISIRESLPPNQSRSDIQPIAGTKVIWPIRSNGEEGNWQIEQKRLKTIYDKGYVRLGSFTDKGMAITYLKSGEQSKIENGIFEIVGRRDDGSVLEGEMLEDRTYIPGTQWDISTHNATYQGSQLLRKIIGIRFDFPKSLYATHDTIRFFVANKPNALILDFFTGSGTTLHAVNLLNAEDGGHRRCILVTNNEVSDAEAKDLTKQGYHPGDAEWEQYGIARYVTWPRTVCSIEGHDVKGQPLKGNYLGSDMAMADGFKANAVYFKLGFLDKNTVALGKQFRELLPILWMKAGAVGKCPTLEDGALPSMLVFPRNKFAVLLDDRDYMEFVAALDEHPEIETVYIVTDSEAGYRDMISGMENKHTYQLYRDYLDNFRINSVRR